MSEKQVVRLMDGTSAEVDAKGAILLGYLEEIYRDVVAGRLALVYVAHKSLDPRERIGSCLIFWDDKSLQDMSTYLQDQSKWCRNMGSVWEGTAPPRNRSFVTH